MNEVNRISIEQKSMIREIVYWGIVSKGTIDSSYDVLMWIRVGLVLRE